MLYLFIYLGYLRGFQHCTGHITMGSFMGRGNQYIQLVKVLYCKLLTNDKQPPAFPLEVGPGTNSDLRGGRRECYHSATVAPCTTRSKTWLRFILFSLSSVTNYQLSCIGLGFKCITTVAPYCMFNSIYYRRLTDCLLPSPRRYYFHDRLSGCLFLVGLCKYHLLELYEKKNHQMGLGPTYRFH